MPWTQEVFGGNPIVHSDPSILFATQNRVEPLASVPYVDFNFDFLKIGARTYRWKTSLVFAAGFYSFEYDAVDGVRAYINDVLLIPKYPDINSWKVQSQTKYSTQTQLAASGAYNLRVEYFSSKYSGRVRFYWNLVK